MENYITDDALFIAAAQVSNTTDPFLSVWTVFDILIKERDLRAGNQDHPLLGEANFSPHEHCYHDFIVGLSPNDTSTEYRCCKCGGRR